MIFAARISFQPMLADGVRHLRKPCPVFAKFQQISRGKKLDTVRWRIAERLEQPRCDEDWHVMRLAVQDPRRLLCRQAGGQLAEQSQKLLLLLFHNQQEH